MSLQKLLSLHKGMQAGVGVQSYKTYERDREIRLKFCPKCDIGTCTTLVWGGPSVVSDGPSLIESCDFCVSMKLSSTPVLVPKGAYMYVYVCPWPVPGSLCVLCLCAHHTLHSSGYWWGTLPGLSTMYMYMNNVLSSSVGRVSAWYAVCCGFESRLRGLILFSGRKELHVSSSVLALHCPVPMTELSCSTLYMVYVCRNTEDDSVWFLP